MSFSVFAYTADDPQVEDMRCELQRTRKEKTGLERARLETSQPSAQPHGSYADREGGRGGRQGPGTQLSGEKRRFWMRVKWMVLKDSRANGNGCRVTFLYLFIPG